MDKKTRQALEDSITKWEDNLRHAQGTGTLYLIKTGADNCALCTRNRGTNYSQCNGCPIVDVTLVNGCKDTPYYKVYDAIYQARACHNYQNMVTLRKAIKDEINFLKSLRPVEVEHQPIDLEELLGLLVKGNGVTVYTAYKGCAAPRVSEQTIKFITTKGYYVATLWTDTGHSLGDMGILPRKHKQKTFKTRKEAEIYLGTYKETCPTCGKEK